jgi:hypothetical protein
MQTDVQKSTLQTKEMENINSSNICKARVHHLQTTFMSDMYM